MTVATTSVPLLDLKAQHATMRSEIADAIAEVVESQWFIMGPNVSALEEEVAEYVGVKHAIGCGSGSDALLLALMAVGVGHGDEVLCPSYTFFATAGAIYRLGAKPVFVDLDPTTYNICTKSTREKAATCTNLKAIIPVHLYGQSCDLDGIIALADDLQIPVIEDAAQAIGTKDTKGNMVGTRGLMGCFSFFPSKNLGGYGDGGIITTNDDATAEMLRVLRVHGSKPKYYHKFAGVNSRLDAIQAAVLRVKLPYLESWHEGRAKNAALYTELFHGAGAITSDNALSTDGFQLRTPLAPDAPARHIYNQYCIRVPATLRDELRDHLKSNDIGTEVYYPVPLHMQDCFAELGCKEGDLPNTESAALETLALPIYPELSEEQVRYVATTVIDFVNSRS
jgi:dTDP-4-amino-4,6-dideoxygalactose transaminase